MSNWTLVSEARPTEGAVVEVSTPGGDVRPLIYASGLWWLPDRSMYVYFTPVAWRVIA